MDGNCTQGTYVMLKSIRLIYLTLVSSSICGALKGGDTQEREVSNTIFYTSREIYVARATEVVISPHG